MYKKNSQVISKEQLELPVNIKSSLYDLQITDDEKIHEWINPLMKFANGVKINAEQTKDGQIIGIDRSPVRENEQNLNDLGGLL